MGKQLQHIYTWSILSVGGTTDFYEKKAQVLSLKPLSGSDQQTSSSWHSVLWGDLWWHVSSSAVHNAELWPFDLCILPEAQKRLWHLQTRQQGEVCHAVIPWVRMSGQGGDVTAKLPKYSGCDWEEEKEVMKVQMKLPSRVSGDIKEKMFIE